MNTSAKPFPAPMGRCAQQFWASLGALVGHPSEALSGANGSVCATILGFEGLRVHTKNCLIEDSCSGDVFIEVKCCSKLIKIHQKLIK